jgi:hypothetical protein
VETLIPTLEMFFGKTNYVRNRELEFSLKDISKSELVKKLRKP